MPFWIIKDRITQVYADAIVCSTNTRLPSGESAVTEVFREAGRELEQTYLQMGDVSPGKSRATDGYSLPCRYVIHTCAPVWQDGENGETEQLVSCYEESLRLSEELGCTSVVFPLISSLSNPGQDEILLRIAIETIHRYLEDHDLTVCLTGPNPDLYHMNRERFQNIHRYIRQKLDFSLAGIPMENEDEPEMMKVRAEDLSEKKGDSWSSGGIVSAPEASWGDVSEYSTLNLGDSMPGGGLWHDDMLEFMAPQPGGSMPDAGLFEYLRKYRDKSFRDMLLQKIDEKQMTDAECYRKANIDRKLFNKIKNQPDYHPGKSTALALAVALELSLDETQELLHKAGFYLSHSDWFDLIVEYFIQEGDYDIYRINEALYFFNLRLLGSMA